MGSERIMTTQQQFLDLLSDIEPSTTTVNDCSSAHNTLRDALKVHNEFSKVHVHTFLSGSYKRSTAVFGHFKRMLHLARSMLRPTGLDPSNIHNF